MHNKDRVEIRLAGQGGQGLVLAGIILADAAIRDGKNAVQTQSYGPEARGGASRSEVIIASGEIDYPKVTQADILLCMSQEACDKYYHELAPHGLLIADQDHVERLHLPSAIAVPLTTWAEEITGRRITASVVALGFLNGLTALVSQPALEQAVAARVPHRTEELNLKALRYGLEQAYHWQKTH